MSPVGARRVIRTYSRQRKHSLYNEEPPTKRRRVEKTGENIETENANTTTSILPPTSHLPARDASTPPPSSPKATEIFSDDPPQSTPPSSPMPCDASPPRPRRRPMFAFLKRKHKPEPSAKEPLTERSHNAPSPPKPPPKKKRLVQMQLDLVAEVSKTCKVCGMEYIPSHAEDAALHRKFHAMNVGGVDISKALSEKLKQNQVWSGGDRSFIAVVTRRDTPALRNKASEVLKVVNTELGAVPISDEILWSQTRNSITANAQVQGQGEGQKAQQSKKGTGEYLTSDRFKAYLFVQGQKCVGACLAERIQEAFRVLDQDDAAYTGQLPAGPDSSSISIDATTTPAILGVSRIWTSNLHRKHGLATRLLDSARSDFLYGMTVDKADVAFSQPTESGGQLARKWFRQRAGWLVYTD